jgi:uncharacterized protein YkwD
VPALIVGSEAPHPVKRCVFFSALAALLAALVLTVAFSGRARGRDLPPCLEADKSPTQLTMHALRSSVLCLVNRVREHYELQPLNFNADLRASATRHSLDMVANDYLAHDGPHGGTLDDRVGHSGYLRRAGAFRIGENIGGGVGRRFGSPLATYRAWMHSPSHRANILTAGFRDFGVGVARGFPGLDGLGGATYTLDFGARR